MTMTALSPSRSALALGLSLLLILCTTSEIPSDKGGPNDDWFFACSGGKLEQVQHLLEKRPDYYAHASTPEGETCLHLASIPGSADITKLVLEAGGDPNARTTFSGGLRMHPLSWNAYAGHVDSVRMLLDFGANPNADVDSSQGGAPMTALDIVDKFLAVNEDDERFVRMRDLLVERGGKRYADLSWTETSTS